ncbi:hypothetical protein A2U01_0117656, partial [Trifolium medium]|nr:hypothetical protein [Trifolium medium]
AATDGSEAMKMNHLEFAIEKMKSELKSAVISEESRKTCFP